MVALFLKTTAKHFGALQIKLRVWTLLVSGRFTVVKGLPFEYSFTCSTNCWCFCTTGSYTFKFVPSPFHDLITDMTHRYVILHYFHSSFTLQYMSMTSFFGDREKKTSTKSWHQDKMCNGKKIFKKKERKCWWEKKIQQTCIAQKCPLCKCVFNMLMI